VLTPGPRPERRQRHAEQADALTGREEPLQENGTDTMASIAARVATGTSAVRLRVTCRKSAYLAVSVTVRPRIADPSQ
jgi:hypothetical protein